MVLYDLAKAFVEEADRIDIDMETGEILEAPDFDKLGMEFDDKVESCAIWYKSLLAEAEAHKAEKAEQEKKQKTYERKAEYFKKYMDSCMKLAGSTKLETPKVKVSYRKSSEVVIDDNAVLPEEYTKTKIEVAPDKMKIKEAYKNGVTLDGVSVVEKQNIQIK